MSKDYIETVKQNIKMFIEMGDNREAESRVYMCKDLAFHGLIDFDQYNEVKTYWLSLTSGMECVG